MESIWDAQVGRSRLCARMCATCVFQPGNRMRLRPGRLRDLVESARGTTPEGIDGSYITCHETLSYSGTGVAPAVCRGFYDRYSTQSLQVIERLWGWVEIDPPDHIGGGPMKVHKECATCTCVSADEPWLDGPATMDLFQVSYKSLLRWEKVGKLPTVRTPTGHRRWRQFDVDAVRDGRPLPYRDQTGRVVAESSVRPRETAVGGLAPDDDTERRDENDRRWHANHRGLS